MKRYENNVGKVMPIRKFGTINGKEVKFCRLVSIAKADAMIYYMDFLSDDLEKLGSRWISGHMYRYHVLNKPY